MTDAMVGRWVEISGRLERETSKDPDDLRELDVATVRLVPVVLPKPPAAAPPLRRQRPNRRDRPHGTGADASHLQRLHRRRHRKLRSLPKTASPVPAIGLAGLLSLGVRLHASFVPSPATRLMQRTRTATEGTTAHAVAPFVVVR